MAVKKKTTRRKPVRKRAVKKPAPKKRRINKMAVKKRTYKRTYNRGGNSNLKTVALAVLTIHFLSNLLSGLTKSLLSPKKGEKPLISAQYSKLVVPLLIYIIAKKKWINIPSLEIVALTNLITQLVNMLMNKDNQGYGAIVPSQTVQDMPGQIQAPPQRKSILDLPGRRRVARTNF